MRNEITRARRVSFKSNICPQITMFEILSDIATIVGLFAAGVGWKMTGEIGPLRAVSLALKSKLIGGPNSGMKSIRFSQIGDLNMLLNNVTRDFYIVVEGPKGVGKSTMIDTCLKGKKGVVRVMISPSTKEDDVVSICQNEIIGGAGWKVNMNLSANTNRVLFWYHLFFRGQFPIVVMHTSELAPGTLPAELTGAVRRLSRLGINVVVDASPNSLQPDLLTTTREHVIYVEELSRDDIRSLPQLHQLFAVLDEERLSDVVLDLLGGIPSLYLNLDSELKKRGETVSDAVTKFLLRRLNSVDEEAVSLCTDIPKFEEVLTLLKDRDQIDVTELSSRGLELPSPCNILRLTDLGPTTELVVQPTSPMVALYCKHDSSDEKASEAVLQLIKTARG